MKLTLSLFFVLAICAVCNSQIHEITSEFIEKEVSRGRTYIVAFLKAGPQWNNLDQATVEKDQITHLNHLFSLKASGKLSVFGPFVGKEDLKGLCIFSSSDVNEVKKLLEGDPHIRSGYMAYEIHTWFGFPDDKLPD